MKRLYHLFGASLLVLALAAAPLRAATREQKTLELASKVVQVVAVNPNQGVPHALLQNARGVAIIPGVVKAGLLVDGRFGRGVLLVRQPNGTWSNPVFITLSGRGIGLQAGVESSDVVLIFRTQESLDHILRGKGNLTLGTEAAVAVGPIGGESEKAVGWRPAEVYSYSRGHGLFAGVSLEGDRLQVEGAANEAFYSIRHCGPTEALGHKGIPAAEGLRGQLNRLSMPPAVPPPVPFWGYGEHKNR